MIESQWNECTDPQPMLGHLHGKASQRKLGLFTLACCRRIWHLLMDGRSKQAVEIADQFVEGFLDAGDLNRAQGLACHASWAVDDERNAAWVETASRKMLRAAEAVEMALWAIAGRGGVACVLESLIADEDEATQEKEHADLSELVREIFGNPFQAVAINRAWLTSTVMSLARTIYDDRAFDRLPILADALEDAGCTSKEMLGHCRGDGEHVRGCWVVDLVLGKE